MGIQVAPSEGAIFRGKDIPGHARLHSAVSCAKMAEVIEMPFRLWTRVGGPWKHVLGGVRIGATWRIPLNRPCAAAMRLFVKLLRPLVLRRIRTTRTYMYGPYVRAVFTAGRLYGPYVKYGPSLRPVRTGVEKCTRTYGPSVQPVHTGAFFGHPYVRAVRTVLKKCTRAYVFTGRTYG